MSIKWNKTIEKLAKELGEEFNAIKVTTHELPNLSGDYRIVVHFKEGGNVSETWNAYEGPRAVEMAFTRLRAKLLMRLKNDPDTKVEEGILLRSEEEREKYDKEADRIRQEEREKILAIPCADCDEQLAYIERLQGFVREIKSSWDNDGDSGFALYDEATELLSRFTNYETDLQQQLTAAREDINRLTAHVAELKRKCKSGLEIGIKHAIEITSIYARQGRDRHATAAEIDTKTMRLTKDLLTATEQPEEGEE